MLLQNVLQKRLNSTLFKLRQSTRKKQQKIEAELEWRKAQLKQMELKKHIEIANVKMTAAYQEIKFVGQLRCLAEGMKITSIYLEQNNLLVICSYNKSHVFGYRANIYISTAFKTLIQPNCLLGLLVWREGGGCIFAEGYIPGVDSEENGARFPNL